ncbi:hypothetical protein CVT26_007538 [Gymnopilus dilepis]|uniref:Protein-S-isoprenylcysteine O-methyltransferase n=1 Tax=Gymnopilus dilepis TaxID=231916 RepID=A0A409WWQ1_9AGAR|nr:hypothetical protein CVT26_007538 [Gymnopilus dilepis]
MSLVKIPFILASCWAFKKAITPPNPPAARTDKAIESNLMEMRWYTAHSPTYATALQWFAGLAEAATIVAYNYRSSPISTAILSTLVLKSGNPGGLHLSATTTIGCIMMLSGALVRLSTYRYLGKFFKFEASIQKDHKLVTGGPYSIVRHPSYTGLLLTHPGWFLWQFGEGSWLRESGLLDTIPGQIFVGLYSLVMIIGTLYLTIGRMAKEDAALRAHFGSEWDEWASRVRFRVIPGVW